MTDPDLIVVGAGHNSLITAAYLSAAGMRVLVLEGQKLPGGDTMSEELTLPGFLHDSCSTAHTLIQGNPLLQRNELKLDSFGLRYLQPDPVFVMPFQDGESFTMYRDLERTRREIARYSARDAVAFILLLDDWDKLKPLQAEERNQPPLSAEDTNRLWAGGPLGDEGLRIRMSSGLDVIRERFESPHIQTAIAWLATLTLQSIELPLTGVLPLALTAGRQSNGWAIPAGGSGSLPAALIKIIKAAGGEVVCGSWVKRIIVESEANSKRRAVGVETEGETYRAKRGVVSTAHVTQLAEQLGDNLDRDSRVMIEGWQPGLTMFVSHYALDEAPRYRTQAGDVASVAMGALESIENLQLMLANFNAGQLHLEQPFFLCLSPTIMDPQRAPDGKHTLKIISKQPYALEGGAERWDEIKEEVSDRLLEKYLAYTTNLTRGNVLGRHIESPLDLERRNPNNFRGSCHGGALVPSQSGLFRPAPDWSQYRTPINRFYLTGSCTHPGGSVSGFPGRNAARVIFDALGLSWSDALANVTSMLAENSRLMDRTFVQRPS
jgi:phytoene dehydrogenase-like protein